MTRSVLALAMLFTASGIGHFTFHDFLVRAVPSWLPHPDALVSVTGILELLGAVGLLIPFLREAAGWCFIVLLVAVFPANVQMLATARAMNGPAWIEAVLWLRLPLQPLLIVMVYRSVTLPSRYARLQSA